MSLLIILDKFYTVTLTQVTVNKENRRKQHKILSNIIYAKILFCQTSTVNITKLLSYNRHIRSLINQIVTV